MNLISKLILIGLILLVGYIIYYLIKYRNKGTCSCCTNCSLKDIQIEIKNMKK